MPLPVLSGVPLIDSLEIEGRRVFIRVDLNTTPGADVAEIRKLRVQAALPSIRYASEAGAQVIVAAHSSVPRGAPGADASLAEAGLLIAEQLETELYLPEDIVGDSAKKVIFDLRDGQICLLENLALHPGEEQNDESFALQLARLFDIYVNDAPGALDQRLASTVLVPRYSRVWALGLALKQELPIFERLSLPEAPLVSVVCSATPEGVPLSVLETLALRSQTLCLGGSLKGAFAAAQGRAEALAFPANFLARCRTLLETCRDRGVELCLLPDDPNDPDTESQLLRIGERIRRAGTVIGYGKLPRSETATARTRWLIEAMTTTSGLSALVGDDAVLAAQEAAEDLTPALGFVAKSGFPVLKLLRGEPLPGLDALAALSSHSPLDTARQHR